MPTPSHSTSARARVAHPGAARVFRPAPAASDLTILQSGSKCFASLLTPGAILTRRRRLGLGLRWRRLWFRRLLRARLARRRRIAHWFVLSSHTKDSTSSTSQMLANRRFLPMVWSCSSCAL
jgi:hypothetical protein